MAPAVKVLRMSNNLTTEVAASFLGVSSARVRKLVQEGRIPAEKRGRDYFIRQDDLDAYQLYGRKPRGRPPMAEMPSERVRESPPPYRASGPVKMAVGRGEIFQGDTIEVLRGLPERSFQLIIADPPYFQVLVGESWDNAWQSPGDYLDWTLRWVRECRRVLAPDGLLYVFGQLGKREHIWLHACSMLAKEMQFHDMIIWDRAVGYNERYDSFTPQYEMVLALRHEANSKPYFNKDAVRLPYDEDTIETYLKDKRYKDRGARERHLRKGKYATNILRVPSLKGASKEKIGHPSQKPIALIEHLIASSSERGDHVLDPFLGSGTTAAACEQLGRTWVGVERDAGYCALAAKRVEALLVNPELSLA